jgi:hypothetical protein
MRRSALGDRNLLRPELQFVMDRDLWFRLAARARFMRIDRVLAFDRHQRHRKVLKAEHAAERRLFDRENRALPADLLIALAVRARIRFGGTRRVAILPRELDTPISLRIPSTTKRLAWQLIAPRKLLPFGGDGGRAGRQCCAS